MHHNHLGIIRGYCVEYESPFRQVVPKSGNVVIVRGSGSLTLFAMVPQCQAGHYPFYHKNCQIITDQFYARNGHLMSVIG